MAHRHLCTFLSDSFPVVKNEAMLIQHRVYEWVKNTLAENPTFYCCHVHFCKISSGFINTRPSGCRTMKMSVSFPSKEKAKADTSPPGNQQWIQQSCAGIWNVWRCLIFLIRRAQRVGGTGRSRCGCWGRGRCWAEIEDTVTISTRRIIWWVQLTWLWYPQLFMLVSIMKETISEHLTVW